MSISGSLRTLRASLIEDDWPGEYSDHDRRDGLGKSTQAPQPYRAVVSIVPEPIRHSTRKNVDSIAPLGKSVILWSVAALIAALALGLLTGVTF